MTPVFDCSPTFRKTFRWIEWLLVAAFFLVYGSDFFRNGAWASFLAIVVLSIGFVGLSWTLPTRRAVWQRQIYLLFGISLALSIRLIGLEWDLFLFLYIVKSCFLLERKRLSGWLITVTVLNIVGYYCALLQRFPSASMGMLNATGTQQLGRWMLEFILIYCAVVAFVVLLSLIVITEQKSRRRAEALAQQVETLAATLERTRIARDIHDSLGHLLTDLNARLSVAQALRDRDPTEAAQAVDMAKLLASQSMTEVKRSLQIIRKSDFHLDQALIALVEQLRHHQNIRVQWDITLPLLPLSTRHHIYCMVKEGLINIQKHAHASEVHLRTHFTLQQLYVELEDNGQGFDPTTASNGFGLKGIAERVQLLRGTLMINSMQGAGTQIQIIIPL